jgi:hypothetical protein
MGFRGAALELEPGPPAADEDEAEPAAFLLLFPGTDADTAALPALALGAAELELPLISALLRFMLPKVENSVITIFRRQICVHDRIPEGLSILKQYTDRSDITFGLQPVFLLLASLRSSPGLSRADSR